MIKTLTDNEARFIMMAYNGLLERWRVSDGVKVSDGENKRNQLVKRLMNQGYNMQAMAIRSLKLYLIHERRKTEKQEAVKKRISKRLMDSKMRKLGQA